MSICSSISQAYACSASGVSKSRQLGLWFIIGFQYNRDAFDVGYHSHKLCEATKLLLRVSFFYPVELDVIFGIQVAFGDASQWYIERGRAAELVF